MNTHELITKSLNPRQQEAALCTDGPLLILAGAGSGKTRVLTYRTAHLIATGSATPQQILAVTFTNKAAREMEHRILKLLNELDIPVFDRMWISTFHSICVRILRENFHLLDYQPGFGIYDQSEQLSMIKKVCQAMELDEKAYVPKALQAFINDAKNRGLRPEQLERKMPRRDTVPLDVYKRYEEDMKRANSMDFGDLLLKVHELFDSYPPVLESFQDRFRYIMVDEYQDTNRIQYLLIQQLAAARKNLCVVGDEDQSIYSWRGADISNILSFEKDFPNCKVVKLEQNYRSTRNIVEAATQVIKNNQERKDKTLFSENAPGERIVVQEETNEYDEARFVVKKIKDILSDSGRQAASSSQGEKKFDDVAIFYRTNAQSRVLEEQLRSQDIPYRIVGGVKFYDRMEVKDILGYLKLVMNPADDISFKRIINVPARGIGKTTVERLEALSAEKRISMIQAAAAAVDSREFNAGTTSKIRGFLELIQTLRKSAQELPMLEFYNDVIDKSAYVLRLKDENTTEADARIDNLEELANAIGKFAEERGEEGTLQSFLEEMSLVSDADDIEEDTNVVTLMTLHISKGLEFPIVFMVGLEEGLFPSQRGGEFEDQGVEEERRLMYVGMTRAREILTLSYARSRRIWGTERFNVPSRFIKEIPEQYVTSKAIARPRIMNAYAEHNYSSARHPLMQDKHPSYEDESQDESSSPVAGADLQKGMRVRHPTYGVGNVFKTEGTGGDLKVSVVFGDNTVKKFVAKYARLERV